MIPTDVPAEAKPWSWGCYADVVASVRSATHLRMLGQLVMLYANDNKGRYPADWASLAGDYLAHPYFANPRSDTLLPRGELSGVEQRAWAERSAATLRDYIYTGAGIHSGSPETEVLGYENPNRVWGDVHVLFNDGHVERLSRTEAAALIGFPDVPPTDAPAARDPLDPTCLPDAAALQSARNLREIAKAMMMYANDFKGRYPNDLGTLFDVARMDVATFVNPRGDTEVPVGLSREDQIAWVNAATDYVYVGAGKGASMDSEVVLAYENPAEMKDGINILFNDGRVEFREMRWAVETLRRAGVTGVA